MSRDREELEDQVEESRREVERRLAAVRASIARETGVLPKARYILLALIAGSTGFALAARRRSKRKRARAAVRDGAARSPATRRDA